MSEKVSDTFCEYGIGFDKHYILGSFYEKGIMGYDKDEKKAFEYYKLSADDGLSTSQTQCYENLIESLLENLD